MCEKRATKRAQGKSHAFTNEIYLFAYTLIEVILHQGDDNLILQYMIYIANRGIDTSIAKNKNTTHKQNSKNICKLSKRTIGQSNARSRDL